MLLSELTNTFFPLCSLFISVFLFWLLFSRKNVENIETKLYSYLVVCGLLESLLYFMICFTGDFIFSDSTAFIYEFFNKILYCIYVLWMTFFYFYAWIITFGYDKRKFSLLKFGFSGFDFVVCLLMMVSPVRLTLNLVNKTSNAE